MSKFFSPHFTYKELQSPDTKEIVLRDGFIDSLENLRYNFGKPMNITSGCRSIDYNMRIGGEKRSFHIYDSEFWGEKGACAVDIKMENGQLRGDFVSLAWDMGFSIIIYNTFIHIDLRSDYTDMKQIMLRGK